MTCHVNKSDPGHMRLDQQITKNAQTTFDTPPKNDVEKKNVKKNERQLQTFFRYTKTQQRKPQIITKISPFW